MTRTPAETSQIIREAIDECKHEWKETGETTSYEKEVACDKCETLDSIKRFSVYDKFPLEPTNPNYLEHGKHWGEMLNWARKQDWWWDFEDSFYDSTFEGQGDCFKWELIANESSLAEHIAEYLSKEEGK